jgi:general secretion pathway protein E
MVTAYDANAIKRRAVEQGMVTLRQDGAQKVLNGITTIEEIFRVTQLLFIFNRLIKFTNFA